MPESPAFLDVEASLTGRRWIGTTPEIDRLGQAIAQANGLPEIVGRILARRGIATGEARAHLAPALRDLMPDPSSLRDMDRAAARFWQAVRGGERIAIFADYDVDGGASAALLLTWLRGLGRTASLYVPDRIDEGYGPNVPAMQRLGATHDLVVCVDCGSLSFEPIAAAGCDVVVLDHHLAGETLPPALAVVNPNRQDERGDLGYLCAAGVVFMMLVAVNRLMRREGAAAPDLLGLLDLVALATVADVAPLVGLNRALVRQGLAVMRGGTRPGLRALAEVSRLDRAPDPYALGFLFGPRVNAGGRIGAADLGARLLASEDPHEAAALAERLDRLNGERREIEAAVLAAARAQVEARGTHGPLVWAAGDGWHPGVVGIVAARLKETYGRPSVVIGFDGDAGKGSGRSVAGVDFGAAVARLMREGLITKGGGHRMAVGLNLDRLKLGPAMDRLAEFVAAAGAAARETRALEIEGIVAPAAATAELARAIASAGPYGAGSPAPRVALAAARILQARPVGSGHLALRIGGPTGARALDAIAFRAMEWDLGQQICAADGRPMHLVGRLESEFWNGRERAKLHLEDAAPAWSQNPA
jgi:single-stranded-DNA-specific exonuclease